MTTDPVTGHLAEPLSGPRQGLLTEPITGDPAGRDTRPTVPRRTQRLDRVVIRFAGDSGDGMQLAGDRFTSQAAAFGNDLSTLPDFPAEIRAPAGTVRGVSSFQVHFADHDILTPGDRPDVLVAMNPAALRANVGSGTRRTRWRTAHWTATQCMPRT
jgi:2-oxoglutarate ferredoxin oxidoreductase subunit alpha